VIFKDDDIGKDFKNLRKWIEIVLKNKAKASIGLIGKYISKDKELVEYLNNLDNAKIEVFAHGYSHSQIPFILRKYIGNNRILPTEFDRNEKRHNNYLKKYRHAESKYLKTKAIAFGPPGNVWNETVINPLIKNDFKIMFSWKKASHDLYTIPLCDNFSKQSLDDYIQVYSKNKDKEIYVLQFHHANLTSKQFDILPEVIDYLKKEKRIFITPKELITIAKKDKKIKDLIKPKKLV
jgi:hypothetical protein